jgi:hypothetical protein
MPVIEEQIGKGVVGEPTNLCHKEERSDAISSACSTDAGPNRWGWERTVIVPDGNGTITYEIAGTYEIAVLCPILTPEKTWP